MTDESIDAAPADEPISVPGVEAALVPDVHVDAPKLSEDVADLRFKAPDHITSLTFSTGRVATIDDGVLTVPDDLVPAERASLVAYGFTPLS